MVRKRYPYTYVPITDPRERIRGLRSAADRADDPALAARYRAAADETECQLNEATRSQDAPSS